MQTKTNIKPLFLPALVLLLIGTLAFSSGDNQEKAIAQKTIEIKQEVKTEEVIDYAFDLKNLMADLETSVQGNIVMPDIERGWYFGNENEKKYGTPNNWLFHEDGESSKWVSSNFTEELKIEEKKLLCLETAGQFLYSCLETTSSECEYTTQSTCYCPEGMEWSEEEGCMNE